MTIKADYTRSDIVEELRYAAQWAEAERDILDPRYAAEAADEIERLRADYLAIKECSDHNAALGAKDRDRALAAEARLAEAVEVVRTLLEAYSAYFKPGNPWADKVRETLGIEAPETHDTTNPFAPRERPKKSFRLMTDDERRTAGLDPNGGFDGPTGAE